MYLQRQLISRTGFSGTQSELRVHTPIPRCPSASIVANFLRLGPGFVTTKHV
jgi:hypothetical protein